LSGCAGEKPKNQARQEGRFGLQDVNNKKTMREDIAFIMELCYNKCIQV
jgi:hypothetical protein